MSLDCFFGCFNMSVFKLGRVRSLFAVHVPCKSQYGTLHYEKISTTVLETDSPLVKAWGYGNIRVSCCGRYFGYYFDVVVGLPQPFFLGNNEQEAWDRLPHARSFIEEISGLLTPTQEIDATSTNQPSHPYTDDARVRDRSPEIPGYGYSRIHHAKQTNAGIQRSIKTSSVGPFIHHKPSCMRH